MCEFANKVIGTVVTAVPEERPLLMTRKIPREFQTNTVFRIGRPYGAWGCGARGTTNRSRLRRCFHAERGCVEDQPQRVIASGHA
jgi:hypothetical protein